VTQGKWHAILTLSDLSDSKDGEWAARHQLELYDIDADAGCVDDMASKEFTQAARFRKAIVNWLANADPTLRASRPNLDRAAKMNLAALGYAASDDSVGGELFDAACECSECLKFK
jgi:hypothetical protein